MSEKKKPWAVRAVFGRTVDEMASHLEDALNGLAEEGFSIRLDEMHPKDGFSYLIVAHREEEAPAPQLHVVALGGSGSQMFRAPEIKPITNGFLEALVKEIPTGDWDAVEKNAPKIVPNIIGKYTSTDLVAIADDLDASLKAHADDHKGDPKECPYHRAIAAVSKMLRERVNLHIS